MSYLWMRNGLFVPNTTAPTYTLTDVDVGHTIAVMVTGKTPGNDPVARVSAIVKISPASAPTAPSHETGAPTPTASAIWEPVDATRPEEAD